MAIQRLLKQLMDRVGSLILLIVLSPILLVCSVALVLDSPGSVFFRQDRLGKYAKIFSILKFRTMVVNAEKIGAGLMVSQNDPRITRVGSILREYRLDELPQLINVLRGEMSLIGPRPLLPKDLPNYNEYEMQRLNELPGMTGWQQVNGGSRHDWSTRIEYDIYYIQNWSIWLDLRILLMTPLVVLKADSVYGADSFQRSAVITRNTLDDNDPSS